MKQEIQKSFSSWEELSEYFFNKENGQIYFLSNNTNNIHKGKIPICEIRVSKDKIILYLSTGNNVILTDDILKNKLLILKEISIIELIKEKPRLCKIYFGHNHPYSIIGKDYGIRVVYDINIEKNEYELNSLDFGEGFINSDPYVVTIELLTNDEIKHLFFMNNN